MPYAWHLKLRRAICKAIVHQIRSDDTSILPPKELEQVMNISQNGEYIVDVSGQVLDAYLAKEARRDELEYIQNHRIYHKVPIQ